MSNSSSPWWKHSVVYQIYPISFFDSNGDGIGDLNGIFLKLDYLKDLGVDVIWLSPIYKSPLADMGYDISDYKDIDGRYGTLEDWDRLLHAIHARGMKLIMDLVVNHSSDEHEWFVNSKRSKKDLKRDWYIWRPPKYDVNMIRHPPNNWKSVFQGSAWAYDEETEEYYLHLYVSKQPDLNWDNPEVRHAVWDLMRFWLDRGCDGFRMDVINLISKVEGLPDAPVLDAKEEFQPASAYFANGPRAHEYIKEMHTEVLSKYDILTVGETPFTHSSDELAAYVLPANDELNMVFQFELMDLDSPSILPGEDHLPLIYRPWKLSAFKEIVTRWQQFRRDEGYWNAVFIENHDHPRSVSRFGNDTTDVLQALSAKMLAILHITQSGTLYIFQGQELGLKNFPRSWGIEEYKDVASQNYWNRIKQRRAEEQRKTPDKVDMEDLLDNFQKKARDHARVPMQWDASPHAGFTSGTPWMRVNDDYKTWNAAVQVQDSKSVHAFWKRALKLRKRYGFLVDGEFSELLREHEKVFVYTRSDNKNSSLALVLLNFTGEEVKVDLPGEPNRATYHLVLGNYPDEKKLGSSVTLRPYEGQIFMKDLLNK